MPFNPKPRPRTNKELSSPRPYWVQIHTNDDELENRKVFKTWDAVLMQCDIIMAQRADVQAVYLLDGRLPEEGLAFPPEMSVWCKWGPAARTPEDWVKCDVDKQLARFAMRGI